MRVPLVAGHELLQQLGQFAVLIGAAFYQLSGNVFRNVPGPALRRVEGNDTNGFGKLPLKKIVDDGLVIRIFDIGLSPCATNPAEVVEHQIKSRSMAGMIDGD